MERKFKIYQCRDGFQIAEELTGARLEDGLDFLVRPNKSANWCIPVFNIVIDEGYELVGEEIIDCSLPVQVLYFVDGVMTISDQDKQRKDALEMNAALNEAFRIAQVTRAEFYLHNPVFQRDFIAAAHAEALEINAAIDNMIACRQTIADKKPDFMQETWELVRLGNEYKEAGRKWYKWAKSTALKLWGKTAEGQ